MNVSVSLLADLETTEAAVWYDIKERGVGERFLQALEDAYERIQTSPEGFPEVEPGIRRIRVKPFPYHVYYRVEGQVLRVLRVVHGHRHPRTWRT